MKIYQHTISTKNPVASIIPGKTLIHTTPAPVIAALTSRGLNILVAWSEANPPTMLPHQDH
ncbi:hypothetical protein CFP56_008308 [Quercus suber]|uniref:Uncharacterized protein n=1 Tax=Quercus suber TaxID=58331 RepID=A0AAW0L4S7_QUESU